MSNKLEEKEEPTFPLTARAKKKAKEKEKEPVEVETDKREETKEKISSKRQERSATKIASDDPGDTYETWRTSIFKPGIHKLRIWYREPDSKTFVNPPQPLLDDMIPFSDLCAAHKRGAIIRVQLYKPNAQGKMQPQTPPLEIPIAPDKEYQVTGYGNPFSVSGALAANQPYPGAYSVEKLLEWSEKQAEKREALQEKTLTLTQQNSNNWLQTLMALQQNNPKTAQNDQQFMLMMMNMMQQSAQSQTAMITGMFQAMTQQSQQSTQLLVAALGNNKGDDNMMKLYELQQNQNNILLQNALQGGDLKGQVALLKELQEFTEPTALGEVAKIAEAINLGENLRNLTEAAGERIKDGSKGSNTGAPPAIPPPANRANKALPAAQQQQEQTAISTEQNQAIQQAAIDQAKEALKDPKKSGLFELLIQIKTAYLAGSKAEDLAEIIWSSNQALSITVNRFESQTIIENINKYHKSFDCTELTTSAGRDFVLDFLTELRRKESNYGVSQP